MSLKFNTIPQKRLLQGVTSVSTSFYLNNILSFDGQTNLTPADFGSIAYCAFRNDTGTILELMEIDPTTIIAGGAITINKRGLSFNGDLTTETTALKLDWPVNTTVMLGTDVPQIFEWLKEYIDGIAIAGAPDSTTAIKGLVKMSVAPATAASPIAVGTNDGRVPVAYAVDSVGTDAYAITPSPAETAYVTGKEYTFKAGTANTGACTLNVSALGAKTIKKNVSTDLATGDILANQIIVCKYDGTNMQIVNTTIKYLNVQNFTSSGTWTKPDGGIYAHIELWGAGGSGGSGVSSGGGGGGGGGAYVERWIPISSLGSTETVTLGNGGTAVTTGVNGNVGGNSTFGSWLTAYGGGGGGQNSIGGGGGGGAGVLSVGVSTTSGTGGNGGSPVKGIGAVGVAGTESSFGGGGGGSGVSGGATNTPGGASIFGGGGGGASYDNIGDGTQTVGGNSFYGGGGGGGSATGGTGSAGGTSIVGGNGGAGAVDAATATTGSQPGGGGGGAEAGTSGAGAKGQCIVTVF